MAPVWHVRGAYARLDFEVIEGDVDIEIIRLMLAHAGISANPVGIGTKARSRERSFAIVCAAGLLGSDFRQSSRWPKLEH